MGLISEVTAIWKGLREEWELIPRAYHLIFAHVMGVQGLYFLLTLQIPLPHTIFGVFLTYASAIGIASGAHRLWAHRSYKANLPLRITLMLMQTLAGQGSIYCWSRDHRLHHKYSETDADPHNIKRGIFFTHIGWAMLKEHPEVTEKEKTIDFSDLHQDPVVAFQHKYFRIFDLVLYHALPILIPYYLWLPSLYMCVATNYFRFILSYNVSSLGNSVAHTWTRKPYEKTIGPSDVSWLSLIIVGEGWHNFHHVFPWDYRSTDVGLYFYNLATMFIDLMAKIGWAFDLKTVPDDLVKKRAARTGDGSHPSIAQNDKGLQRSDSDGFLNVSVLFVDANENIENVFDKSGKIDKLDVGDIGAGPWGWGDNDIPVEDVEQTVITHEKGE